MTDAKYYQANKKLYKARANESRKRQRVNNKAFILEYLRNHPCVDCGISDIRVLQFDHRDRELKTAPISSLIASRGRLETEIALCDVRCANCHMIRTADQFGWSRDNVLQ